MSIPIENRSRVPGGVTKGGEFATERLSESAVTLTEPAPTASMPAPDEELTPEQLMAAALSSARHHSHVQGLRFEPAEDIAQDTIALILAARSRNPSVVVSAAYVHQVARGFVAHRTRGSLSARDRKAIGIYQERLRKFEAEHGHKPSSRQSEAIATEIRDNWHDPRRKPSLDFVELAARGHSLSLDAEVAVLGVKSKETLLDVISEQRPQEEVDNSVDPDSVTARALGKAARRHKAAARDDLWSALQERYEGLPPAQSGAVTSAAARAHLKVIEEHGIEQAIADWNAGDDQTPACRALFAPFGDIGPDEKDEVAGLLTRHSSYAAQIHNAAMRTAIFRARKSPAHEQDSQSDGSAHVEQAEDSPGA